MAASTYGTRAATRRHAAPRAAQPSVRPARAVPRAFQGAIWAGGAVVLSMWWSNTQSVVGLGGWLTGAGRITGLLAGYACAVLLLLMARVPLLDRSIGTDRLARWHAMGGRYTVTLTLAHAVLIIYGYAVTEKTGVADQTRTVILEYPQMLNATAALLIFLATGVVSARIARRRMPYELWHYLHFATYLAVFLAFAHQLANGAEFAENQQVRTGWFALYLGVSALLIWYRVLLPVRRALRHRLRVAEVRPEAPGVVSVYLTGRRLDRLRARSGQFFRWRFLARGMWWTANPYSLSVPPNSRYLRITVKAVGNHSERLADLRPGTRVWAEGPYGGFTADRRTARKTLLLGGGVGITPLRTLFETLPGDVAFIYRARSPEDLALRSELDAVAESRNTRVLYSVDTPAEYSWPLTADVLTDFVPDVAQRDVYVCGPPGMAEAAARALREAGVPRRRIHQESFAF